MADHNETKDRWTRQAAGWGSAALVAALMWPVGQNWVERPADGFPLSYYPMFTKRRAGTTVVYHAVAVNAAGEQVDLPGACAGPGGMNTNRRQMRKMVRDGRAQDLADQVAAHLVRSGRASRLGAVRVEVVESAYDLEAFRFGVHSPVSRQTHASADVKEPRS